MLIIYDIFLVFFIIVRELNHIQLFHILLGHLTYKTHYYIVKVEVFL